MKFNFLMKKPKNEILNHQGGKAYTISHELELYTSVVTSMVSDSFYEKADERLNRLRELIQKNDPEYVAKLAVYTRKYMNLRSTPIVLSVELARIHKGDDLVRKTVRNVISRADEITEMLAYYQIANQRTKKQKAKQIKQTITKRFGRFVQ